MSYNMENLLEIMQCTTEFKTIDEIIQFHTEHKLHKSDSDYQICELLIVHFPNAILTILNGKFNLPSMYDLMIIKCISDIGGPGVDNIYIRILDIYNKRKEINNGNNETIK